MYIWLYSTDFYIYKLMEYIYIYIYACIIYKPIWINIVNSFCPNWVLKYIHITFDKYTARYIEILIHDLYIYTCSCGPSLSNSHCSKSTRNSSLLVPPAAHALCTASGTLRRPLGFLSQSLRKRASTLAYRFKASLSSSLSPSSSSGGGCAAGTYRKEITEEVRIMWFAKEKQFQ